VVNPNTLESMIFKGKFMAVNNRALYSQCVKQKIKEIDEEKDLDTLNYA